MNVKEAKATVLYLDYYSRFARGSARLSPQEEARLSEARELLYQHDDDTAGTDDHNRRV